MGLRVVGRGSGRLAPALAIVGAVAYPVFPLGLAWAVIDRHR
jgi:hypothetical protein